MRIIKIVFGLLFILVMTGCAHQINMTADVSQLQPTPEVQLIQKNVGYYFIESREKVVETAGGGGDKVKYSPYKDIEGGVFKVLNNTFKSALSITSDKDVAISKNDLSYIMALEVSTNSSSPSLFTWPPTVFGVNVVANITNNSGQPVTRILVTGEGRAEFDEFKGNHSLAGNRASVDALKKMQAALLNSPALTATNAKPSIDANISVLVPPKSKEERLRDLKRFFDGGLITNDIYMERQKAILGS